MWGSRGNKQGVAVNPTGFCFQTDTGNSRSSEVGVGGAAGGPSGAADAPGTENGAEDGGAAGSRGQLPRLSRNGGGPRDRPARLSESRKPGRVGQGGRRPRGPWAHSLAPRLRAGRQLPSAPLGRLASGPGRPRRKRPFLLVPRDCDASDARALKSPAKGASEPQGKRA